MVALASAVVAMPSAPPAKGAAPPAKGAAQPLAPTVKLAAPVSTDGIVSGSGVARFLGSPGANVAGRLVSIAGQPNGNGYWVLRSDGGLYKYGTALSYGSPVGSNFKISAAAIAAHPSGKGYWIVSALGGVYAYGAAHHHGQPAFLGSPIVAMQSTRTGNGYWLVGADGGVFSFGDAVFLGSAYGSANARGGIVGMATTPTDQGMFLLARDGALFGYGDAAVIGSAWPSSAGAAGIATTRSGKGYVIVETTGRMRAFGDALTGPAPRPTSSHISGPGNRHRPPAASAADLAARVTNVKVAVDRRSIAIASATGFHSFWVLNNPVPASTVLASRGSTGALTAAIQYNLAARGYWLNVNGSYDNETQQAVYAFQKYSRRSRTGTVTAGDYRALLTAPRPVARTTGSGRIVELDLARQIVMFVNNGRVEWLFNTSTGNDQPYTVGGVTQIARTPTGRFTVAREIDGLRIGRLGALWRPKYFTSDGIAFHGAASVPPYPASHGCSRLSNAAINFAWAANLLPIGTSVWVY